MLLPDAPFRLSPNPGGSLTAVQVIGRDPLIHRYWEALEGRSLVLAAPRRLGTHWADLLDALLDDLEEGAAAQGRRVVLFWDEFPLFLGDVATAGRAADAMLLLDRLRASRGRHAHLRMVLYGSVSFEEVIGVLRRQGYANDPFNDTAKERVPALEEEGARTLARALLRGAELPGVDLDTLPEHLVRLSEGHPFVLQHLAYGLRYERAATTEAADSVLDRLLDAENDPLELRHYLERLGLYVGANAAEKARVLLDRLAERGEMSTSELLAALADPEAARDALQRLRQESYIQRTGDTVRFSFGFLRTWWKRERGL
jgi:hypothetical protein